MNDITSPAAIFTGSIAKHYDHYLGPMFFEEYAIEVASRFDPSSFSLPWNYAPAQVALRIIFERHFRRQQN